MQIDLAATVDGEEVDGRPATNISHEVGSGQLLPGLDEVLVGLSADDSTTFTTKLVGGDFAGRDADVAVTVRVGQGEAAARARRRVRPAGQRVRHARRAAGGHARAAAAGQAHGAALRRRATRPSRPLDRRDRRAGARVAWWRTRSSSRKESMSEQLERVGA